MKNYKYESLLVFTHRYFPKPDSWTIVLLAWNMLLRSKPSQLSWECFARWWPLGAVFTLRHPNLLRPQHTGCGGCGKSPNGCWKLLTILDSKAPFTNSGFSYAGVSETQGYLKIQEFPWSFWVPCELSSEYWKINPVSIFQQISRMIFKFSPRQKQMARKCSLQHFSSARRRTEHLLEQHTPCHHRT